MTSTVITFSFLHLREPHQALAEILIGRRLSSRQLAVVMRFLELAANMENSPAEVTLESMGCDALKSLV